MDKSELSSTIKKIRNDMRKDAGLNGDLDRIPQLTWLLFLKVFDDLEKQKELLDPNKYVPMIGNGFRWRDWASDEDKGLTGDELLDFVNNELLPYLRELKGVELGDSRDIISSIFKEQNNRMLSGYLLKDVINSIEKINFNSKDDIFTVSHIYESMLKELRDAAGDSGEFYTPRPVVRFIVDRINPEIGETIYDPACGTGGFLVESFESLKSQVKNTEELEIIQESVFGTEKKPLPYLLGMMNLLLHEMDSPNIIRNNSLSIPINEIGEKQKFDIIITNPPFGGEEEKGILSNFPPHLRTSETTLLFLVLIMRSLKENGRAAVIAPDGILSSSGAGVEIRKMLVEEFNLYAIIKLPEGIFAPYTDIPSNILFFNNDSYTKNDIWYYDLPLPEGRKKYTKTMPLRFEEFSDCCKLWEKFEETDNSWIIEYEKIKENNYNLDNKNPNISFIYENKDPIELIGEIECQIDILKDTLDQFKESLDNFNEFANNTEFKLFKVNKFAKQVKRKINLEDDVEYVYLGMRSSVGGLFKKSNKLGSEIKAKTANVVKEGDFVYSRLFARNGSFGIAKAEHEGCCVSGEFPTFEIDKDIIIPEYLLLYFSLPSVWAYVESKCKGTTKASRFRFKEVFFNEMIIPVPNLDLQKEMIEISEYLKKSSEIEKFMVKQHEGLILSFLASIFKDHL
ncbi:MAG: N-6 DNA methylase [Methanobacterium formicicum]